MGGETNLPRPPLEAVARVLGYLRHRDGVLRHNSPGRLRRHWRRMAGEQGKQGLGIFPHVHDLAGGAVDGRHPPDHGHPVSDVSALYSFVVCPSGLGVSRLKCSQEQFFYSLYRGEYLGRKPNCNGGSGVHSCCLFVSTDSPGVDCVGPSSPSNSSKTTIQVVNTQEPYLFKS